MRKPPLILSVALVILSFLFPSVSTRAEETANKWEHDISAFEQKDQEAFPPKHAVLFVGSSSIRLWKTLASDFPNHKVINRGFGGSFLSDTAHFADRIVLPYEPSFIVVYAGGNDLNTHHTPEQVCDAFKSLVSRVREKQPSTPIAFISLAGNPRRWEQVENVKKANALVEAFTKEQANLLFIDVFHAMLGADGVPRPEIFGPDRLHMNAEGYELWTSIVGKYLPSSDLAEK